MLPSLLPPPPLQLPAPVPAAQFCRSADQTRLPPPLSPACRFTAPGDRLVACDSPAGRLGLSVCYDLRFPELYQRLAWEMGAQVRRQAQLC